MTQLTRREMLRLSVVPLVGLTGTGGVAAALARSSNSHAEIEFTTVVGSTNSSLTLVRDGGARLTLPVSIAGAGESASRGNPFQIGERVVLNIQDQGVVGIEPLTDFISGVVERQDGNRVIVAGGTFVIDDWSLARVQAEAGDGTSSVVPLGGVGLTPGAEVGVLARRGTGVGPRRIAAVFADGVGG